jgi:hypothetical protein
MKCASLPIAYFTFFAMGPAFLTTVPKEWILRNSTASPSLSPTLAKAKVNTLILTRKLNGIDYHTLFFM